jgi:serine/threonine-protein phosphatase 2A regulatory subunit B'
MPTSSRRVMAAPKGGMKGPQSAKVIERSNMILKNRKMMSTPRSDMTVAPIGPKAVMTTYVDVKSTPMAQLPDLASVPPTQFNDLMRQKLSECCVACNLSSAHDDNSATKARYLFEIADFIAKPRYFQLCDAQTFDKLFEMIAANLIRTLPPLPQMAKSPLLGDDIKDTWVDGAWPHLSLVYDVFQSFLESPQLAPAQHVKHFDNAFLIPFLGLFNSMDNREREAVKKVLHGLYLRFNQLRLKIRQILQQIMLTFIYEEKYFNGMNELLDFYESIVSGFTVPLKPENIQFLFEIILPLHAAEFLHVFHENLVACVADFVDKEPELLPKVLRKLLIYWPSSTLKGRLFLNEVGRLVDVMTEDQFKEVADELFVLLARLVEGCNFQLSEATICLWRSDIFVGFTAQFATITYPLIVPAVYRCGVTHWNAAIKNLAVSILRICMQVAPEVYEQVTKGFQGIEAHAAMRVEAEKGAWLEVARQAEGYDSDISIVHLPGPIEQLFAPPSSVALQEKG